MSHGIVDTPSPNFNARPAGTSISMLVVHYTGMESAEAALQRLCDPAAEVSAHYCIDEDGRVHRLVDESERAWHAGISQWRGETDINGLSIGVELVNPGHEFGYRPFPDAQMAAFQELAQGILERHPIPARNVVGHSDVAPTRKSDPGELFDWAGMAAADIGLWPQSGQAPPVPASSVTGCLSEIGYDVTDLDAAVRAFQRRFLPWSVSGEADGDTCGRIADVLAVIKGLS